MPAPFKLTKDFVYGSYKKLIRSWEDAVMQHIQLGRFRSTLDFDHDSLAKKIGRMEKRWPWLRETFERDEATMREVMADRYPKDFHKDWMERTEDVD